MNIKSAKMRWGIRSVPSKSFRRLNPIGFPMNEHSKINRSGAAVLASIAHSQGDGPHHKSGNTAPILVNVAAFGANVFSLSAYTHGLPQMTGMLAMDTRKVAAGYCTSRIVGGKVYNDLEDEVGKIEGLIIDAENDKGPYVVISIGSADVGGRLIAVPYSKLRLDNYKIVLAGITNKELMAMSEFKYAIH